MELEFNELIKKLTPDPKAYYECHNEPAKGFTLLMILVMNIKKYPFIEHHLPKYIKENPDEINKKNQRNFTALMLAVIGRDTYSSEKVIKMLLEYGADCEPLYYYDTIDKESMILINKTLTKMIKEKMDELALYENHFLYCPESDKVKQIEQNFFEGVQNLTEGGGVQKKNNID